MRKEPAKRIAELDWVTGWRRVMCYLARAGVGKSLKRQMNRRARRRGKGECEKGEENGEK